VRSLKGAILGLARLGVSVFLVLLLVHHIGSEKLAQLPQILLSIGWGKVIVAWIVLLMGVAAAIARWMVLVRAFDMQLPVKEGVLLYFIGLFFNNFLPTSVGGDAVKGIYLYKFSKDGIRTFLSIFLDRLVGAYVVLSTGFIALLAFGIGNVPSQVRWALVVPLVIISGFGIFFFRKQKYRHFIRSALNMVSRGNRPFRIASGSRT